MLKKLIAIILGSLMVSSLNAVSIYNQDGRNLDFSGRVKLEAKTDTSNQSQAALDNGASRITISGSQMVVDQVKVFGIVEWGYNPVIEGFQELENRLGYLGINYKGHIFSVGRRWSSYYNIAGWTDMYETSGADANSAYQEGSLYGTSRANSYQYNTSFGIVDLSLQYQGNQVIEDKNGLERERQWGAGGSLIFRADKNFKFGLSAQQVKLRAEEDLPLLVVFGFNFANDIVEVALTGSYQDNVMDSGIISINDNDSAIGMESYISFKYTKKGSKIYLGNNYLQYSYQDNSSGAISKMINSAYNYILIGATYNILADYRCYVYTEYKQDLRSKEDRYFMFKENIPRENLFSIGARYSF